MKTKIIILLFCLIGWNAVCVAQMSNREARIAYVLKNIGVDRNKQKELRPIVMKYLAEKKEAEADYEAMKDRLKATIKAQKLTDAQADKLLKLKWESDQKVLDLRRQYTPKFRKVLTGAKTWLCFDLMNDSKAKIRGEKDTEED